MKDQKTKIVASAQVTYFLVRNCKKKKDNKINKLLRGSTTYVSFLLRCNFIWWLLQDSNFYKACAPSLGKLLAHPAACLSMLVMDLLVLAASVHNHISKIYTCELHDHPL